jgi:hypothetical protein
MEDGLNINMLESSELNQKDLQDLGLLPAEDGSMTPAQESEEPSQKTEKNSDKPVDQQNEPSTSSEEIVESLLNPESVANIEEDKTNDNTPPKGTVNHSNIFQLAKALKEEGVLSAVTEEDLKEIKSAADLVEAINKEVDSKLDSTTKRVKEALTNGIEPSKVQTYENAINYLDSTISSLDVEGSFC